MQELNDGMRQLWSGDLAGAADTLARALARGAKPAAVPLGEALLALGRAADAAAAFAQGEDGRARAGEGRALLALGRADEAAAALRQAALLTPDADTLLALAEAEAAAGDLGAAMAAAGRALKLSPGDPAAERLLARLRAEPAPPASGAPCDPEAGDFDEDLAKLGYQGPKLLLDAVRALRPQAAGFDVLDLGCGTGLAGAAFRPLAAALVGCDLAPRMLEVAARRGVYDCLEEGDLLETLRRDEAAWDLILAADVMIYFGDLAGVFQAAAQALKPAGLFAFTVERGADDGWELSSRGRFQHGASYLRNEAVRTGLAVRHLAAVGELRRERNVPVEGFACVLERA